MKKIVIIIFFASLLFAKTDDILSFHKTKTFINMMVEKYHFDRDYVESVLANFQKDERTLKKYKGRYKAGTTSATWITYKKHILTHSMIKDARNFKRKYYCTLKKAQRVYGVDMNYIVAFLGVESRFGKYTGNHIVLDSLVTLAFYKNRMQKYFLKELKELFLLSREQNLDIFSLTGSFAGAMGIVQQMPSIQRKYGVDFNKDGIKNPWNVEDAIGTIANFLRKNGWRKGGKVAVKTNFRGRSFKKLYCSYKSKYRISKLKRLGIRAIKRFPYRWAYLLKLRYKHHQEIWLGGKNFRVITTYNHSTNYGMGIYLLAKRIRYR